MNFEDDAVVEPTNAQLKELSGLVEHQINLETTVDALTEDLVTAKKDLKKIQEGALPEMMHGLGFDLLKTATGYTIKIDRGIAASITKANQAAAFAWLKKTKNEAIIKTELKMVYTGMEEKKLSKVFKVLDKAGIQYGINEGIHSGTLKAFVRNELEDGREVDKSITVFEYGIAKISGE